jgi:hypothetical protein
MPEKWGKIFLTTAKKPKISGSLDPFSFFFKAFKK